MGALEIDPAKGKMLKRDFAFFESSQDKLAEMRQMMAEMQAISTRDLPERQPRDSRGAATLGAAPFTQRVVSPQASAKRKEAAKLKEQAEAAAAEAAAEEAASEGAKEKEPAA